MARGVCKGIVYLLVFVCFLVASTRPPALSEAFVATGSCDLVAGTPDGHHAEILAKQAKLSRVPTARPLSGADRSTPRLRSSSLHSLKAGIFAISRRASSVTLAGQRALVGRLPDAPTQAELMVFLN